MSTITSENTKKKLYYKPVLGLNVHHPSSSHRFGASNAQRISFKKTFNKIDFFSLRKKSYIHRKKKRISDFEGELLTAFDEYLLVGLRLVKKGEVR